MNQLAIIDNCLISSCHAWVTRLHQPNLYILTAIYKCNFQDHYCNSHNYLFIQPQNVKRQTPNEDERRVIRCCGR